MKQSQLAEKIFQNKTAVQALVDADGSVADILGVAAIHGHIGCLPPLKLEAVLIEQQADGRIVPQNPGLACAEGA